MHCSELLNTKEAAEYCRVSPSFLNALRVRGGGPHFVKLGRCVRYRVNDLSAWLETRLYISTSDCELLGNSVGRR